MVKTMATPRAQNHEAVVIRSQPENALRLSAPKSQRCRRAIAGIPSRPAWNDRVVRCRYQFIDQRRRRFAIPKCLSENKLNPVNHL